MKLDKVAGSGNDEFYTPPSAVAPLLRYLKAGASAWCPFDTAESNFVKALAAAGHEVWHSHIADGNDFFALDPPPCDYVISNPPYSLKTEVFARLFELGIPFAMLVGVVGLFESKRRFQMFAEHDFEIMYFNKRVAYFKDFYEQKPSLHPPFSSVYLTRGVLPDRIVFETLPTA